MSTRPIIKSGQSKLDKVALSVDFDPLFYNFTELWDYWAIGAGNCRAVLDDKLLKDGSTATYELEVAYTIEASAPARDSQPEVTSWTRGAQAGMDSVKIVLDLQLNPGSLPALRRRKE